MVLISEILYLKRKLHLENKTGGKRVWFVLLIINSIISWLEFMGLGKKKPERILVLTYCLWNDIWK